MSLESSDSDLQTQPPLVGPRVSAEMAGSRHCVRAPGRRRHPVYCVCRRSVEFHYNSVLCFCMSELSHNSRLAFQKHEGMNYFLNLSWDETVLKVVLMKYFHSQRLSEENDLPAQNDFVKATGLSEITRQVKVPEIPATHTVEREKPPLQLSSGFHVYTAVHPHCLHHPTYMKREGTCWFTNNFLGFDAFVKKYKNMICFS